MCARQARYLETGVEGLGKGHVCQTVTKLVLVVLILTVSGPVRRTNGSSKRVNSSSVCRGSNLSRSARHRPEGDAQSH